MSTPGNDESGAPSEDVVRQTRELFIQYVGEFLAALGDRYPACTGVQAMRLQYGIGIEHAMSEADRIEAESTLVAAYHETMTPYYERVARRDDSVFAAASESVDFVRKTAIAEKWGGADADTRACIYEYLDLLNRFARMHAMYAAVPQDMMSRITDVATKLAQDIESGAVTPDSIDLASVGQSVVSQVGKEELQEFAASMMSNQSQIQGMLQMVMQQQQGASPLSMLAAGLGNTAQTP